MSEKRQYFLCGVGGSGMLPLALILRARGAVVSGSDRALDQGRTAPKFEFLKSRGVALFPQDGSGLVSSDQVLVASAAVEDTVPDVQAALRLGSERLGRAQLLAQLFNAAKTPIGVAGTSGKSTTTAMIAWILHHTGAGPTVMNGAVMKNFVSEDALFASALVGDGPAFVSEIDESDGSIAFFSPKIAVLNNISLDHKTMDELRALFSDFIGKSEIAVLNLDNDETARIAQTTKNTFLTYSLGSDSADYGAKNITPQAFGVSFDVIDHRAETSVRVDLKTPGRHNVSNALAAIAASVAAGVRFQAAAQALNSFTGVKRRFEYVGKADDVTVIDDFGHNPDKITATIKTLKEFPGRLVVMFQPHGFGPLKKMKAEFIECFSKQLGKDDVLLMPQPVYYGGTTDRSVTSSDITKGVDANGIDADALATRDDCGDRIIEIAKSGDRVIIMGARDDTLSVFAEELVTRLSSR